MSPPPPPASLLEMQGEDLCCHEALKGTEPGDDGVGGPWPKRQAVLGCPQGGTGRHRAGQGRSRPSRRAFREPSRLAPGRGPHAGRAGPEGAGRRKGAGWAGSEHQPASGIGGGGGGASRWVALPAPSVTRVRVAGVLPGAGMGRCLLRLCLQVCVD